jgi:hypothetical protein
MGKKQRTNGRIKRILYRGVGFERERERMSATILSRCQQYDNATNWTLKPLSNANGKRNLPMLPEELGAIYT